MDEELAIDGGDPVRSEPFPARAPIGSRERDAVLALFDEAIEAGEAIGYQRDAEEGFGAALADYLGGGFADGVNSGTAGIYVAIRALELDPPAEVIVSPITDPGGQMPVALAGHVPVVADAAPGTYNVGVEEIEERITPRTEAICVGHIMGEPLPMPAIIDLADEHDLAVIEDCAQAIGATTDGRPVGTFGDVAVFSTMFGKHVTTGGQGGAVFTREEELYWRLRRYADRGKPFETDADGNVAASLNLNMDEIAATLGRVQLDRLSDILARRRELVHRIRDRIAALPGVYVPAVPADHDPAYWYWRLGCADSELSCSKAEFCAALDAEGLPVTTRYDARPHLYPWFRNQRVFGTSGRPWQDPDYDGPAEPSWECPNAAAVLDRDFNLAVHEGWGDREVEDAVAAFEKVTAAYG